MKTYDKIFAVTATAIAFICVGCGKSDTADETKPPFVKVQQAAAGDFSAADTYSGTLRGRYESNMAFQVGGKILRRDVQKGSRIKAGDVLMSIDTADVAAQNNAAEAQVASAAANLRLAKENLKRYRQLYEESAVAKAVLDQYQTNYDAALQNYNAALANANLTHNALNYADLTADYDGIVTAINAEAGQVVAAGQTVLTMVRTDELEGQIDVPEHKAGDLHIGDECSVKFWALPDGIAKGTVREISPMADNATRTYNVRISLPAPPAGAELGMTLAVTFEAKNDDAKLYRLPLTALLTKNGEHYVWVVDEKNSVGKKRIDIKDFVGENEVTVTGLRADDLVVTAGTQKLSDGQEVRPMKAGSAS